MLIQTGYIREILAGVSQVSDINMGKAKSFAKLLLILPAIIISVFVNVFICSIVSQTILIQLLTYGVEKHIALFIAILSAVSTYGYIVFYNRIRDFIKHNGATKNE